MAGKNGREKKHHRMRKRNKYFFPGIQYCTVYTTVGLNNSLSQKMYICDTYYLGCT